MVVCCIYCGRDTESKSEVCGRCYGERLPRCFVTAEECIRKPRKGWLDAAKSCIQPYHIEGDGPDFEAYHGESVRDDI